MPAIELTLRYGVEGAASIAHVWTIQSPTATASVAVRTTYRRTNKSMSSSSEVVQVAGNMPAKLQGAPSETEGFAQRYLKVSPNFSRRAFSRFT